ncbi:MAG: hypothetical protein PWP60_807 [Candidatus Atribacteria bacterium]|jgi:uncharacterized protein with HEPN domain|uniref:HepT-like ribonuclease domain-containing protein n=1 Tax=Atrimonas thermophila TaxID=3064161 RepID=UPI0024ABD9B7|nr:hypothetical protein [Candidatus Atribacteria bacterium]
MKLAKPYLEHILQECRFLIEKSEGLCFENFTKDPVLMRAFVRSLEIIGKAVKNLPEDFKKRYPEIPWKEIAGMRDKLIHEYFGVNYRIVWKTVQQEIPKLKVQVEEITKKEGWEHEV